MTSITIVGGGVAGLALAATLDPTRFDVTLIERSPERTTVPTAFGVWPFALRALGRLGLAEQVCSRGLLIDSGTMTADSTRRPISATMSNAGTWLITRPALLQILDAAVPPTVVREQQRITAAAGHGPLAGDLVVAADGVNSVIRATVWGDAPRDTGTVAIRGVLPSGSLPQLDQMNEFWGAGLLFGVGPNPMDDGIGVNWYAAARGSETLPSEALTWARDSAYARFPALVRQTLDAATPELTVVNSIMESAPTRTFVRGRYVLIGDAAHAMSPNLGRGAGEAIMDAVTLGEALNHEGLAGARTYNRTRRWAAQWVRVAAAGARRLALSEQAGRVVVRAAGVAS